LGVDWFNKTFENMQKNWLTSKLLHIVNQGNKQFWMGRRQKYGPYKNDIIEISVI
jgi:hypothetical protein